MKVAKELTPFSYNKIVIIESTQLYLQQQLNNLNNGISDSSRSQ